MGESSSAMNESRAELPSQVQAPSSPAERSTTQLSPQAGASVAPVTSMDAPKASMPRVASYSLPIESLVALTQASQLQWVQSDPQKVAQVRESIANEPAPVHVPRVRPPAVVLNEGPLVLVETKKSLNQLNLPFTQEQS